MPPKRTVVAAPPPPPPPPPKPASETSIAFVGPCESGKTAVTSVLNIHLVAGARMIDKADSEHRFITDRNSSHYRVGNVSQSSYCGTTMRTIRYGSVCGHGGWTIVDCPSVTYTKNFVRSIHLCHAAVLVVPAPRKELFDGLLNIVNIAMMLRAHGIQKLVVAVNKLDVLGDNAELAFDAVTALIINRLKPIGFVLTPQQFAPICSLWRKWFNISAHLSPTPAWAQWFGARKVPTLVDLFKTLDRSAPNRSDIRPYVYASVLRLERVVGIGTIVIGRILQGDLHAGEQVVVSDHCLPAVAKSLEVAFNAMSVVHANDIVGIAVPQIKLNYHQRHLVPRGGIVTNDPDLAFCAAFEATITLVTAFDFRYTAGHKRCATASEQDIAQKEFRRVAGVDCDAAQARVQIASRRQATEDDLWPTSEAEYQQFATQDVVPDYHVHRGESADSAAAAETELHPLYATGGCKRRGLRSFHLGYQPMLAVHGAWLPCNVARINGVRDRQTGKITPLKVGDKPTRGQSMQVVLVPLKPIQLFPFDEVPSMGRFTLHDNGYLVGVGIVTKVYKKSAPLPSWQPEVHSLYPTEFRVIVRTCLLMRVHDSCVWSMLPDDVLLLIFERFAVDFQEPPGPVLLRKKRTRIPRKATDE
eukprot:TRINITY_DN5641_c0_g2_i1.p1 TRINITY_DN5641_c0_g2~~TRINITY_DN5641_c0_g2_i1.p1  ORF type:complete len:642 (-),score=98.08 TRINITY_DN5641_c0_g2_i1:1126-3051(-)